jgi:hypothetical protein
VGRAAGPGRPVGRPVVTDASRDRAGLVASTSGRHARRRQTAAPPPIGCRRPRERHGDRLAEHALTCAHAEVPPAERAARARP